MILLLMGPPGSGKTTLGKNLANRLNYQWIDVDDHVLEPEWKCTVGEKLIQIGEKHFIQEESKVLKEAVATFTPGTVVSLTGSNPMDLSVMESLGSLKNAIFIYLDVHLDDIMMRLGKMKIDRIVGQNMTAACCGKLSADDDNGISTPIREIVDRRAMYYDPWFDVRIWPKQGATIDEVESDVLTRVDEYLMAYCNAFTSTRCTINPGAPLSFIATTWSLGETILSGLARDGGLNVPKKPLPKPTFGQLKRLATLGYRHKAHVVMEKWIHHSQISPQKVDSCVNQAFSTFNHPSVVPIRYLPNENIYLAELFHGPTGSFKDLALQLFPRLVSELLLPHERHVYLVATSGDTGGAVIDGFSRLNESDRKKLAVFVMYPTSGISSIQKLQMVTCESENVKVIGIDGNFDDCQRLVKQLLNDTSLKNDFLKSHSVTLNTANSINWGRIMPQILFHLHDYMEMVHQNFIRLGEKVDLCIPTGNFGNILSATLAKAMDVPYENIICACNKNKVLHEFFTTGAYDLRDRTLEKTISPAIDILVSSNIERLLWSHLGPIKVKEYMEKLAAERYFQVTKEELEEIVGGSGLKSGWCDEQECKETIRRIWRQDKYMADPHTAVAIKVAKEFQHPTRPMVVASTAHYSKFIEECKDIFDEITEKIENPPLHEQIEECKVKAELHTIFIQSDYEAVCHQLSKFINCYFDSNKV